MAAGFTFVKYGPLELSNCLTQQFTQEAVYDDSGTNLLHHKFTVRVVGYFSGRGGAANTTERGSANYFNPAFTFYPRNGVAGAAGSHYTSLRYLFVPRLTFSMWTGARFDAFGNVEVSQASRLLHCEPMLNPSDAYNASQKDVNNGPKVKVIALTRITGDTLIRAELEFEICKIECDSNGNMHNTTGVVSNRWSVSDDVDNNRMTTRTWSGQLRTTSSVVNANSFRGQVVPRLQEGFRRDSMRFVVTEDGLTLQYQVTDREIAYSAPAPATSWELSTTERVERSGQLHNYVDVDVRLSGDRSVDKKELVKLAAAIADAKVFGANRLRSNAYIESLAYTDTYGDNGSTIALRMTALRTGRPGANQAGAIFGMQAAQIGRPIEAADIVRVASDYDANISRGAGQNDPIETSGPISVVGAWASYIQSPCANTHGINPPNIPGATETEGQDGRTTPTIEARIVTELDDDGTLDSYSSQQDEAMYTQYVSESTYATDSIRAHCPIARGSSSEYQSQDTSVVLNLGAGLSRRTIRVSAERLDEQPAILNPPDTFSDTNGITYTLLDSKLLFATGERTADDKRTYRAAYEYQFAMSRAITAVSGSLSTLALRVGANPWETTDAYAVLFGALSEEQIQGT
jgi:hypothetical protein